MSDSVQVEHGSADFNGLLNYGIDMIPIEFFTPS